MSHRQYQAFMTMDYCRIFFLQYSYIFTLTGKEKGTRNKQGGRERFSLPFIHALALALGLLPSTSFPLLRLLLLVKQPSLQLFCWLVETPIELGCSLARLKKEDNIDFLAIFQCFLLVKCQP
jgi:hypothetical protein